MSVSKMIKIAGIVAVSFEGIEALRLKVHRVKPSLRRVATAFMVVAAALSCGVPVAAATTGQRYNSEFDQEIFDYLKKIAPVKTTAGTITKHTSLLDYQRMVEKAAEGFKTANNLT